jgi:hypothetical protein
MRSWQIIEYEMGCLGEEGGLQNGNKVCSVKYWERECMGTAQDVYIVQYLEAKSST